MFTKNEVSMIVQALEVKLASLRRGANTSKEPQFKALYDRSVTEYSALLAKAQAEVFSNEAPSDGSRKKP